MDWEFGMSRTVKGVSHYYTGTAEVRRDPGKPWSWEVGSVMVKRRAGRGVHYFHADADLAAWVRVELRIKYRNAISSAWRRCQEGGDTPREFSEYVRSVV